MPLLACGRVPEANQPVGTCAGKAASIGRKRQRTHFLFSARDLPENPLLFDVPQAQPAIPVTRGQELSLGAEFQAGQAWILAFSIRDRKRQRCCFLAAFEIKKSPAFLHRSQSDCTLTRDCERE